MHRIFGKHNLTRAVLRKVASKGFWSVTDQALFAGSNFVLNVVLARWLGLQDFGAYSVAFSVFMILVPIHGSLFIEPMLVFGSGKYRERLPAYLGVLLYGHWLFMALASGLLLAVGLVWQWLDPGVLSVSLISMALAAPFILFQWTLRRACYAIFQPRLASYSGGIYMLLMLAGVYGLYRSAWLSTPTALAVMGAASLLSVVWLLARLRVQAPPLDGGPMRREIAHDHWNYGSWAIGSRLLKWVPQNLAFLLLPAFAGLGASGALRALTTLLMPAVQINSAFSTILLPTFVRSRNRPGFGRQVWLFTGLLGGAAVLYWLLLGFFGDELTRLLYGVQYADYAGLFWLLGLSPVLVVLKEQISSALRALERPDRVFRASVAPTVFYLTAGVGMMALWGLVGAIVAGLLNAAATVALLVRHLDRTGYRTEPGSDAAATDAAAPTPEGAEPA